MTDDRVRARVDEIIGDAQHIADGYQKPWWQSRGIWGGLIAAGAGMAGLIGYDIDQAQALEIVMALSAAAGGLIAAYGRVRASTPIRRIRKQRPENEQ